MEAELAQGWGGPGETNHLLKQIATYGRVFKGLAGAELVDFIINTAENTSGFYEHSSHTKEIGLRAKDWAIAVERYYRPIRKGRKSASRISF
ncbi:MAG: hypothetical protein AB4038_05155 [Prochloraceae cyanobacterium]